MTLRNTLTPWHMAIVIPARNEEELLARCLLSLDRARAELPAHITSDVVLIADQCIDNTLAVARKYLRGEGIAVASQYGAVGSARALAVETALGRYEGPLNRCWIANTDADCELPLSWLTDQLKLAEQGVQAVAGIVSVDTFEDHPAHVAARFRETYVLHPDGTHPHVHGANFGVRADVYQMAGGWSGLKTAEDHDLWNRLRSQGHLCCSISALEITTSGRIQGRAPGGFARALAAHGVAP